MRWLLALFLLTTNFVYAQPRAAQVTGKVVDENESPLEGVSVIILGNQKGGITNEDGTFSITLPAQRATALVFSHTGYVDQQKNFFLSIGEVENVLIRLKRSGKELETVTVTDERERKEAGLVFLNPKNAIQIPGAVGGVEAMIKTIVG
ncbi:MAG: carboxypeptidase-like regulatory domain-containing protein, partial [Chitinophagaceae bacterium]